MGVVVNPRVLEWAREERRLSPETAAERLGISLDHLSQLESGAHQPSVTELRKIAAKYKITFAALLMPEPLPAATAPRLRDFRTHGGEGAVLDDQMMVELEDVNQQLNLLHDLKLEAPEIFGNRAIRRVHVRDNPFNVAEQERAAFDIPIRRQLGWNTERHAFLTFRNLIEDRGIFVYARNLGSPWNCRGISIWDERGLPTILINSNREEEYGPRIFTLLHEYGHILLRETGISDENRQEVHERFCNQFAADFLMPREAFREEAESIRDNGEWTERDVAALAKRFKVSKSATAIHLETTGVARVGLYNQLRRLWRERGSAPKKGGGISTYPEKMVNRYGVRHVELVLRALDDRRINEIDAHEMLDAKSQHFASLRKEARERLEAYGGGR